jgi:hypothetical protein
VIIWIFENRNLRRILGPNRDENGVWRILHNGELHSLYLSPNLVRVIKSRRLRWTSLVARMKEGRCYLKILTGNPTAKRLQEGRGVEGRRILESNLKK